MLHTILAAISLLFSIAALCKADKVQRNAEQLKDDTEKLIENAQILDKYQEL